MIKKSKIEALILSGNYSDIVIGMELLSQVTPMRKFKSWGKDISKKSYQQVNPDTGRSVMLQFSNKGAFFHYNDRFLIHEDLLYEGNSRAYVWVDHIILHKDYKP